MSFLQREIFSGIKSIFTIQVYRLIIRFKIRLQAIWVFLGQENFIKLLLIVMTLVFLSSITLYLVEPNLTLFDSFWWAIVTMTTVGYGDITPKTNIGRLIGMINMIMGIGLLAILSANIASVLVNSRLREDLGMNTYHFQDHMIICEWNHQAKSIIRELRFESTTRNTPIVLIAPIERKPIDDPLLYFVRGEISDETLERANIQQAKTVIVLGDRDLDYKSRDGKVVLITLTVESINRNVYTIVELADETHIQSAKRAYADEIIVSSNLGSKLISNSAINHGMSEVLTDILTHEYGSQLYKTPVPESESGCTFIELFVYMKKVYSSTIIAIMQGSTGKTISNPSSDYVVEENDYLIIIAPCKHATSNLQKELLSQKIN